MLKVRNLFFVVVAVLIAGLLSPAVHAQDLVILDCDDDTDAFDCAAVTGGATSVSMIAAPSVWNPVTTEDTASGDIADPVFGASGIRDLFGYLAVGATGTVPQAASVVEVNEAGTSVTYTLRDGLVFSDGSPVTMDDILYWFHDVMFNDNLPNSFQDAFLCTDGTPFVYEVLSDSQISVSCPDPFRTFTGNAPPMVMSKAMAEELIADQGIATEPGVVGVKATQEFMGLGADISMFRGVGAYLVTEFVSDQVARYVRNPNFYEVDSNGTRLPYLDNWELIIIPTQGQNLALSNFLNGQTEVLGPRPGDISTILSQAGPGFSVNSGIDTGTPGTGTTWITGNYSDTNPDMAAAYRNVEVRRALSLAMDRTAMVNNVLLGLGTPSYVNVSLASGPFFLGRDNTCADFISAGLATADTCTDGAWVTGEGGTYQVTNLPAPASPALVELMSCLNDQQACWDTASSILDGLGVVDTDGDGVRNIPAGLTDGFDNPGGSNYTIQVTTNVGNTTRENYIQIICDGWNQIGLSCSTNPTSFGTLVTQLLGGEYTGFIMLGLTGVDPAAGINVVPCGTALHLNHVACDPGATSGPDAPDAEQLAVEEAFNAGFAATSVADAQPAFDQMQIAWAENQPWLQLAVQNGLFALRTDRICNTGNTSYSNLDLKFRLDLAGNETSCTTNPQ